MNNCILIIIVVMIAFSGYIYIEGKNNDVIFVKSLLDNREYLVRNNPDKQKAADLIAKIRVKLDKLCAILKKEHPNDKSVKRLIRKFNSNNITESGKNSKYTSYSVNKGEKVVLCIRTRDKREAIIDENIVTFVAIHELAHIQTKSIGHTDEFWNNFKFLLKNAIKNGLYKYVDYSKNNKPYCGMTITDTPLNN